MANEARIARPTALPQLRESRRADHLLSRVASDLGASAYAAHRSPEPGHALVLDALGLDPLLDLGLRLGEGSGAALALPLLQAAVAILADMATFESAGVTDAGR